MAEVGWANGDAAQNRRPLWCRQKSMTNGCKAGSRAKARPTPCSLLAAGLVFLVVVRCVLATQVFGCKWWCGEKPATPFSRQKSATTCRLLVPLGVLDAHVLRHGVALTYSVLLDGSSHIGNRSQLVCNTTPTPIPLLVNLGEGGHSSFPLVTLADAIGGSRASPAPRWPSSNCLECISHSAGRVRRRGKAFQLMLEKTTISCEACLGSSESTAASQRVVGIVFTWVLASSGACLRAISHQVPDIEGPSR